MENKNSMRMKLTEFESISPHTKVNIFEDLTRKDSGHLDEVNDDFIFPNCTGPKLNFIS